MKFNASFDVAIIISLITVFLFANGQAYLGGLLSPFGIDPIVLNFSVQDKIYIGYFPAKGFVYITCLIMIIFILVMILNFINTFDIYKNLIRFLDKKLSRFKVSRESHRIHNSTYFENLDNDFNRHFAIYIFVSIFFLGSLYVLSNTEQKAKEIANQAINQFSFRPIVLKNSSQTPKLYLIKCGSSLCALIDKDKNVTLEDSTNIIFTVKSEK